VSVLEQFLADIYPAAPSPARVTLRSHSPPTADTTAAAAADGMYRVTLVFSVTGSRYCANVGRAHRSNGVYIVAYIRLQASPPLDTSAEHRIPSQHLTGVYKQRCHDIDCKGFSSSPVAMSAELMQRMWKNCDKSCQCNTAGTASIAGTTNQ